MFISLFHREAFKSQSNSYIFRLFLINLKQNIFPDNKRENLRLLFVSGFVCGEGSCCSENLEHNLLAYSRTYIEKYIKDAVLKVATLIETRARKFDGK